MQDTSRFKNEELVLKVSKNINPDTFNFAKYEAFLDALSVDREYQKDAARTVCNYLFGGAYTNLRTLAEENWHANGVLQEKYQRFSLMERLLQLPEKLACSVDLATGTGKSYVIYATARIALASGMVDRVLVLCPSNTIEAGLLDKFRSLAQDRDLTDLLPADSVYSNPNIIRATESIAEGSICVENIHATYKGTRSAIEDSLKGKGARTLVLCDEAHHIFTPEDEALRKWKEFLLSETFGFRFIVGFSGTCYVGNEYFSDVVARYSLKQALEDKVVKEVRYVAENAVGDQNEKFQLIYGNHKEAKQKYRRIKPLTIIVTKDIGGCKRLTDDLTAFLAAQEGISKEEAAKKILRVHSKRSGTSAQEDKEIPLNLTRLRSGEPDRKDSPVEWITSVSMLTEGWDVKNVFQIVPHEERAFNSKLLIAQVLGRGLRLPPEYKDEQPIVRVFNHDSWSGNIRHLVNEILERDRRITSSPVKKEPSYDFKIHHVDYDKTEDVVETKQETEYNFNMEFVNLTAQRKSLDRETVYEQALTGERQAKRTRVYLEMFPLEKVVADVHNKFKAIDLDTQSNYASLYPKDKIRQLVRNSLDRIDYKGDDVSKENRQRILSAFGNLYRPGSKSIRYKVTPSTVITLNAAERPKDSLTTVMLRRASSTVYFDDLSRTFDEDLAQTLKDLDDDGTLPRNALYPVENRYNFKTCLSVVLTTGEPERRFVRGLVKPENAERISAWLKSTDVGFYEIEYSYSRGDYSKRGTFNPDFFLSLGEKDVLVVEVKGDEEISDASAENQGKRRAAVAHFKLLNELQQERHYHFCYLTPKDYDLFFSELREGKAMSFQSSLDVALMNGTAATQK